MDSLRDNRTTWQRSALSARVLRTLADGHKRIELLGRTLAHPILIAPIPTSACPINKVSWRSRWTRPRSVPAWC
jgi:isopentenyl diphosphate isomerase/L-lactate dehydrogenase-like FMN-dependent dehydrogenase